MGDTIIPIRGASDALLALNNAHALETSFLNNHHFNRMIEEAFYARSVGEVRAFLIALDQDANYDSPNFLWFRERLPHFVYIDRVITAENERRRGHARTLYMDLIAAARKARHSHIVCEVNVDPPNPGSQAFHMALGFKRIGNAQFASGKRVDYLALPL